MASKKTYLLAPNFTFQPDGPLRLGSVIADPFRPTKPLSTIPALPDTITHTELERTISRGNSRSLHSSIWAQFLQTASANIGVGVSKDVLTQYTMDSLETVYFQSDPTDAEAMEYARDGKVRAAMKAGIFGTQPVYMVTGLKIAKGFRLVSEIASTREGNVGASAPVVDQVSLGAKVGFSKGKTVEESLVAGSDIVFAYQLHVIAEKGWRHKRVEADLYEPKSAFLGHEEESVEEKPVEAGTATAADLLDFAEENEDDTVKLVEARDGDGACICITFQEI